MGESGKGRCLQLDGPQGHGERRLHGVVPGERGGRHSLVRVSGEEAVGRGHEGRERARGRGLRHVPLRLWLRAVVTPRALAAYSGRVGRRRGARAQPRTFRHDALGESLEGGDRHLTRGPILLAEVLQLAGHLQSLQHQLLLQIGTLAVKAVDFRPEAVALAGMVPLQHLQAPLQRALHWTGIEVSVAKARISESVARLAKVGDFINKA